MIVVAITTTMNIDNTGLAPKTSLAHYFNHARYLSGCHVGTIPLFDVEKSRLGNAFECRSAHLTWARKDHICDDLKTVKNTGYGILGLGSSRDGCGKH